MSVLQERIVQWCERLKLTRIGAEWRAIADEAATAQISFAEFLGDS